MSDRDESDDGIVPETTQIGVRIPQHEWDAFRAFVEENSGAIRGNLSVEVRRALEEYRRANGGGDTHDRLTRLEERSEKIDEKLDRLLDALEAKNKKDDSVFSSSAETDGGATVANESPGPNTKVSKRLNAIEAEITEKINPGEKSIPARVVERAIENHAGMSDPTIRTYTRKLQKRNVIFPNPRDDSKFFVDVVEFVSFIDAQVRDELLDWEKRGDLIDVHFDDDEDRWEDVSNVDNLEGYGGE